MSIPARPHENCYWVTDYLMAGEYPGALMPDYARQRLAEIVDSGIRTFIDLTESTEPLRPYAGLVAELASERHEALEYERFPIPDRGVTSPREMNAILDRIDRCIGEERPVYLHCWGGVGRTGTVVGCYLVRHGATPEDAMKAIASHWETVEKRFRHPCSPETMEQLKMIRLWPTLKDAT